MNRKGLKELNDLLKGHKADEGKLRYDLIPADVEEEIAKVFTFGATKYGDRNWEKGVDRSRLIAAARRHLASYLLGHQTDEECGTHHLANSIVNLMMIIHFDKVDDALPSGPFDDGFR